jgi:hypothetical protein
VESFFSGSTADPPPSEPPISPSGRKGAAWLPSHISWPLVEAGAAGGGIVLLILAALWFAGVLSPRSNGLNPLDARLAAVELKLREISSTPAPANIDLKTIDDLASRLGKLEAAAAAPTQPLSDAAIVSRLTAVEEAMKSFQGKLADLDRRADDNATAVREARGRADAALLAANAARSAPADRSAIESLTNRIAALEQTTKAAADDLAKRAATTGDRSARLAVAAQSLRAAVERGDPFAAELAAVKPLAADAQALTPLEPFAASGVPAQALLARQLSELVPAMRQLAAVPAPEGSFLDRLQANAERLVRIRPIGETPGDDSAAIINRIEAKAARSDIAGALMELAKLPAPIRAPAEEWIKKARGRDIAVDLSRRIASDAIAALGRPSP